MQLRRLRRLRRLRLLQLWRRLRRRQRQRRLRMLRRQRRQRQQRRRQRLLLLAEGGGAFFSTPNTGIADAGLADTGLADAGLADTGLADTGLADTGLADTGLAGTGLADTGLATEGMPAGLSMPICYSVAAADLHSTAADLHSTASIPAAADTGLAKNGLLDSGLAKSGLVDSALVDSGLSDTGLAGGYASSVPSDSDLHRTARSSSRGGDFGRTVLDFGHSFSDESREPPVGHALLSRELPVGHALPHSATFSSPTAAFAVAFALAQPGSPLASPHFDSGADARRVVPDTYFESGAHALAVASAEASATAALVASNHFSRELHLHAKGALGRFVTTSQNVGSRGACRPR
ncbi:hypothetical protein T492DRAFT_912264 [Pavlovales sp. CCMP2436]|nr:hypothetical protein T492DRAFT_912264 [Pavlovales sp. CCMP2436]